MPTHEEGIWGSRASERTVLAAMWLSGAAGYPNAEVEVHAFACLCAARDLRTGRVGSQEYLLANPDHHEWDVSTIRRASPVENDCGIARWTIIESPDLVALVSTTFAPLP